MKDFKEFRDFISQDCLHEIKTTINNLNGLTSIDFVGTGLSKEAITALASANAYVTTRILFLMLERYHEWNESFPESQHELPPQ